jgi:hypothetical protein
MIVPIVTNYTTCPDNSIIRALVRKGQVQRAGGNDSW